MGTLARNGLKQGFFLFEIDKMSSLNFFNLVVNLSPLSDCVVMRQVSPTIKWGREFFFQKKFFNGVDTNYSLS